MVNTFPVALLVSVLLGTLSGIGIGGGSILMLWLTLIAQLPPETAKALNLMFFIPGALLSSFLRIRYGQLRIKPIIPAALVGCAAAGIAAFFSSNLSTELIRKIMGILFIGIGIREICYRPRKAR